MQHRSGRCGCRSAIGRLRGEALFFDGFHGADRAVLGQGQLEQHRRRVGGVRPLPAGADALRRWPRPRPGRPAWPDRPSAISKVVVTPVPAGGLELSWTVFDELRCSGRRRLRGRRGAGGENQHHGDGRQPPPRLCTFHHSTAPLRLMAPIDISPEEARRIEAEGRVLPEIILARRHSRSCWHFKIGPSRVLPRRLERPGRYI